MKKIILLLIISLTLCACTTNEVKEPVSTNVPTQEIVQTEETEGIIKPLLTSDEIMNKLPNDLKTYIQDNIEYFDVSSLRNIGRDLSNLVFTNLNGEEIKISDFKGQKVILDFVGDFCGFCKEFTKDNYFPIKEANSDINFIQVFISGNEFDVEMFYQDINKNPDYDTTCPQKDEYTNILVDMDLLSIPAFIFINEEGIVTWTYMGTLDKNSFKNHLELAYGDLAPIKTLDQKLLNTITRTYKDIKSELDDETITKINYFKPENISLEDYDKAIYSDLYKTITPPMIVDYNGKKITWDEMKDKKILINFFLVNDDDKNTNIFKTLNEVSQIYPEYIIINIGLASNGLDPDIYFDTSDINFPGFLLSSKSDKLNSEFHKLSLINVPSLYFLNEGGIVSGLLIDDYDINKFNSVHDIFFNE